jgi:hypothetical protein
MGGQQRLRCALARQQALFGGGDLADLVIAQTGGARGLRLVLYMGAVEALSIGTQHYVYASGDDAL